MERARRVGKGGSFTQSQNNKSANHSHKNKKSPNQNHKNKHKIAQMETFR